MLADCSTSRGRCCRRSGRPARSTAAPTNRCSSAPGSRWPPRSATSTRRCSGRPASSRAWSSPPTAPALPVDEHRRQAGAVRARAADHRGLGSDGRVQYALEGRSSSSAAAVAVAAGRAEDRRRLGRYRARCEAGTGHQRGVLRAGLRRAGGAVLGPVRPRRHPRAHVGRQPNHIIRAALEAIAYQIRDVLDAMQADAGIPIAEIKVDGGASKNNFLMQFQADLLGRAGAPSDRHRNLRAAARRSWPAWRSASGRTRPTSSIHSTSTGRFTPEDGTR